MLTAKLFYSDTTRTQLGVITPSESLSFLSSEPVEIQVAEAVAVIQILKLIKTSEQPQNVVIFCENTSVICAGNWLNSRNHFLYAFKL